MTGLPLLLDLTGRTAVVVGGGRVGLRRCRTLLEAGARVRVIAPSVRAELAELAEPAELPVELERRRYAAGDLDGSWLAVAATDDPAVNAAVAAEAESRRIFCIRADLATGGTARMPAVLRRGALTVSVNAADDPARAAGLRDLLGHLMDTQALIGRPVRPGGGSVALVGGGPGDPELITVRGRRLLFEADVVVTDRLAPRALLAELPAEVEIIDCGKSAHRHNLSQDEINAVIVARAQAGKRVVRLKGGDPFVFGRGGEEMAACLAAGVDVQVVPGITSAIAAPAAAGIPVTHRGTSADFAVVSGHRDAGQPGAEQPAAGWSWPELAVGPATLILLMAMGRLAEIAAELIEHGRPADTPSAVIQHGTLPGQRVLRAPLGELADRAAAGGFTAPAVVVIGAVAALGG
ncbi:MAG TPA: uroporphyrinogen-III C-methyltransferase [Jatrophihabitans sp.]|nr:uroporphyrinogen-III C-methyltransferase [Jatrophihabitans sp.]